MTLNTENLKYMELALDLAGKARGRTSPNPMVGAVIVKDGLVVGTGYHKKAGTPHAEVHALRNAGDLAVGADLYVTLEPCNHFGRTPPCTEAIIRSGIKRVFVAMKDPNPLVSGEGIKRLGAHGIEVFEGLLKEKAYRQNEVFLRYITTKMPFIALKVASSLDGKIASEGGQSQWITGEEARLHGHNLRNIYDAILVGIGTIKADNPQLTCRLPGKEGRDPIRIIVDGKLSIDCQARVFNQVSSARTIVATTAQAPSGKVKEIEEKAQVLVVNHGSRVALPLLLQSLAEMGITSVLVEGGGEINGSFLRDKLVDKFYFYLAPRILGGTKAPGPFQGEGIQALENAVSLTNIQMEYLGQDVLITGYPREKEG